MLVPAAEPPVPGLAPAELAEVTLSEQDGVRYLHLGTPWVQGAMRIAEPWHVELEYIQRMLSALLWLPSESLGQGLAVQLGLGAGALTRFTAQVLKMRTLAVELNPQVIAANRRWFRLPADSKRCSIVQADAAQWVNEAAHQGSARLLFVDLYDHEAAAPVLDGEDFYAACRRCLDAQGVMAVNLFGRQASFALSLQRIEAAFGAAAVWHLQPTREGNTIVVATRQGPAAGIGSGLAPEVLAARADILHSRFGRHGLPVRKWKRMLRQG